MIRRFIIILAIAIFTTTVYADFKSIKQQAKQGDAQAQYALGTIYLKGLSVPKDLTKASHWVKKSANQGHMEAQYTLGAMYLFASISNQNPQDKENAVYWLTKAGKQGHRDAINLLAEMRE